MNGATFAYGWLGGSLTTALLALIAWRVLGKSEQRARDAFASLSSEALRQVSSDFVVLADATLGKTSQQVTLTLEQRDQLFGAMLKPIEAALEKLGAQSEEMERKRVSAYDAISEQVKTLASEANQLSSALRRPTIRGSWGELMLRTVCENAGLVEGEHFVVQDSTEGDGKNGTLRPDMVIKLPKKRVLIIDSKVPLDSFRDAMDARDQESRTSFLRQHAKHVKDHIRKLSAKAYWSRYSDSPDCTVMCIPSEGAYYAAIETDPSILDLASVSRIIVANPMTVVGVLRAVANILGDERLAENALQVREAGRRLYESLSALFGQVQRLGRQLKLAGGAYNGLVEELSTTTSRARELHELGAGVGDLLTDPPSLSMPSKGEKVAD